MNKKNSIHSYKKRWKRIPFVDARIAHLSDGQIIDLLWKIFSRRYGGRRYEYQKKILEEYNIRGVDEENLYQIIPLFFSRHMCQSCKRLMRYKSDHRRINPGEFFLYCSHCSVVIKEKWLKKLRVDSENGFIYFLQRPDNASVKIGFTSGDPIERIQIIDNLQDVDLKIIGVISGSVQRERDIHALLSKSNKKREWFHMSDILVDFIKKIEGDFLDLSSLSFEVPFVKGKGIPLKLSRRRIRKLSHEQICEYGELLACSEGRISWARKKHFEVIDEIDYREYVEGERIFPVLDGKYYYLTF